MRGRRNSKTQKQQRRQQQQYAITDDVYVTKPTRSVHVNGLVAATSALKTAIICAIGCYVLGTTVVLGMLALLGCLALMMLSSRKEDALNIVELTHWERRSAHRYDDYIRMFVRKLAALAKRAMRLHRMVVDYSFTMSIEERTSDLIALIDQPHEYEETEQLLQTQTQSISSLSLPLKVKNAKKVKQAKPNKEENVVIVPSSTISSQEGSATKVTTSVVKQKIATETKSNDTKSDIEVFLTAATNVDTSSSKQSNAVVKKNTKVGVTSPRKKLQETKQLTQQKKSTTSPTGSPKKKKPVTQQQQSPKKAKFLVVSEQPAVIRSAVKTASPSVQQLAAAEASPAVAAVKPVEEKRRSSLEWPMPIPIVQKSRGSIDAGRNSLLLSPKATKKIIQPQALTPPKPPRRASVLKTRAQSDPSSTGQYPAVDTMPVPFESAQNRDVFVMMQELDTMRMQLNAALLTCSDAFPGTLTKDELALLMPLKTVRFSEEHTVFELKNQVEKPRVSLSSFVVPEDEDLYYYDDNLGDLGVDYFG